jgi:hypothetical protein
MDKHDRPYKCLEPGCDKAQGFTYSGGLLRHQREVHKKNHPTGSDLLYCDVPNCNRSNSQPFTRLENLKEHKRRRHITEAAITSPGDQRAMVTPATPAGPPHNRSYKRKRTTSTDFHGELQPGDEQSNVDADSEQVKRLKRTIVLRDKTIGELQGELAKFREQESKLRALVGTNEHCCTS